MRRPSRSSGGEVDETHGILLNCLAFCAEELNDFALAELCWTTAVDLFHAAGRVSDEATAICGRSTVRLNRGRIDAGIEDAELALRLAQELNMSIVAGMAAAAFARGRAMRGEHQAATSALSLVAHQPGAPAFARVAATTGWAAAIVAANDGDHGKAADELGRAMQYGPVALWAGAELAESALHAGRRQTLVEWLSMADEAAAPAPQQSTSSSPASAPSSAPVRTPRNASQRASKRAVRRPCPPSTSLGPSSCTANGYAGSGASSRPESSCRRLWRRSSRTAWPNSLTVPARSCAPRGCERPPCRKPSPTSRRW